ncbi:MAG: hypothetical protein ACK5KO_09620, partial [Arachnia sp.]
VGRVSGLAPLGGPAVVRANRDRFPEADDITYAWQWHPTPQSTTMRDTIDALIEIDEESRIEMKASPGVISGFR